MQLPLARAVSVVQLVVPVTPAVSTPTRFKVMALLTEARGMASPQRHSSPEMQPFVQVVGVEEPGERRLPMVRPSAVLEATFRLPSAVQREAMPRVLPVPTRAQLPLEQVVVVVRQRARQ